MPIRVLHTSLFDPGMTNRPGSVTIPTPSAVVSSSLQEPARGDGGWFVGIDPGVSGGIALLNDNDAYLMPMKKLETVRDLHDWFFTKFYGIKNTVVYLEKVGGYVGGDHARGSHMFVFGQNYGRLEMMLVATATPFEYVTPQAWQKEYGMKRSPGEKDGQWKARLRERAQSLFPRSRPTGATADALLIAEYGRRKRAGANRV